MPAKMPVFCVMTMPSQLCQSKSGTCRLSHQPTPTTTITGNSVTVPTATHLPTLRPVLIAIRCPSITIAAIMPNAN
jgi:hypothetical protein